MRARLSLQSPGERRQWPIDSPVLVGRDTDCDVVLADPTVSRQHAILEPDDQAWRLKDLGSNNGTFVDGKRVITAELTRDASLGFGDVAMRFEIEETVESTATRLRKTLSVPPAKRTKPTAAAIIATLSVIVLLAVTFFEKACRPPREVPSRSSGEAQREP